MQVKLSEKQRAGFHSHSLCVFLWYSLCLGSPKRTGSSLCHWKTKLVAAIFEGSSRYIEIQRKVNLGLWTRLISAQVSNKKTGSSFYRWKMKLVVAIFEGSSRYNEIQREINLSLWTRLAIVLFEQFNLINSL